MELLGSLMKEWEVIRKMRLIDLLQKLAPETLVGLWNIDDKRDKCPTPQTYQKVKNIPWGKISNIIDYEVLAICVNEKNGGLFVRVYDKERLEMSIANSDLAQKIKR